MIKKCSVKENGLRCNRLAFRSAKFSDGRKGYICSRHYRKFKRKMQVEHMLGKTEEEIVRSLKTKLDEYDALPGELVDPEDQK